MMESWDVRDAYEVAGLVLVLDASGMHHLHSSMYYALL
jgi:hypothetical protein